MGLKDAYLVLYNVACTAGWAFVLFITATSLQAGDSAAEYYQRVKDPLIYVQTAAFLEVLHSLFGIVRSPLFTTLIQVASRLVVLWGITYLSPVAQSHWSLYQMVGSWALVEVPRYTFYAVTIMGKPPKAMTWVRYTLFVVLYPTGITGELMQQYVSLGFLATAFPLWHKAVIAIMLSYIPFGPMMIMTMCSRRKKALAPPRPVRKPDGIVWPEDKKGKRSTSAPCKAVWAQSIAGVDDASAIKVQKERNWRFGYMKHVLRNVELCAVSKENALTIAQQGLDAAMKAFEFVRGEETLTFQEAMDKFSDETTEDGRKRKFHTGFIKGTGSRTVTELEVEYPKGSIISKKALIDQLAAWAKYGTIEPSAQKAIAEVANHPEWLDLSDRYFVLLGATSAMGPIKVLTKLGANIIALDINREHVWKRLINEVRDSPATITFPLNRPFEEVKNDDDALFKAAGCNLFTDAPEIRNWVQELYQDKELVMGGYAYLDGELHVRLSIAMVAIMDGVIKGRDAAGYKSAGVAFLCSPTDVFAQPPDAVDAARNNLRKSPLWQRLLSAVTPRKFLAPNVRKPVACDKTSPDDSLTVVDGLVPQQGPNYATAKRLQHWLVMLTHADGKFASSNIAPSTRTASVVHNRMFAAGYNGMPHFVPMEIMDQETSNAVMGALLLHDVCNPNSMSNTPPAKSSKRNPLWLFSDGAFHGGVWRIGYKMGSIGEAAVLVYFAGLYGTGIGAVLGAVAAAAVYQFVLKQD